MLTSRDNYLWLQLWRDRTLDFHQEAVNGLLTRFWPKVGGGQGGRVFVPLCGKSLDMIWLAKQGHDVIGVELSPIAVRSFFKENHLKPVKRRQGKFTLWTHGNISILCGDFFALDKTDLGCVDMVYDRAALTALPEDIRKHYVSHMHEVVPKAADIFLLTIEDAEEGETLEHSQGVDVEVEALYVENFDIRLAHVESLFELDPESPDQSPKRAEYKVYRLNSR